MNRKKKLPRKIKKAPRPRKAPKVELVATFPHGEYKLDGLHIQLVKQIEDLQNEIKLLEEQVKDNAEVNKLAVGPIVAGAEANVGRWSDLWNQQINPLLDKIIAFHGKAEMLVSFDAVPLKTQIAFWSGLAEAIQERVSKHPIR